MLMIALVGLCLVPLLGCLNPVGSRGRFLSASGLLLSLLGGLFIAVDGIPSTRRMCDHLSWVMPWAKLSQAMRQLGNAPDGSAPALRVGDSGFPELVKVVRRYYPQVPRADEPGLLSLIEDRTVGFYRVPIMQGVVTLGGISHPVEPMAGIVVATRTTSPVVVGSEAGLIALIDRYRQSWFITRGLIPVLFGFLWQFLALFFDQRQEEQPALAKTRHTQTQAGDTPAAQSKELDPEDQQETRTTAPKVDVPEP